MLSNNEFIYSETRTGNNLYQELSFQDSDALGDIDEGADITGKFILVLKIDALNIEYWLMIDWIEQKLWKNNSHKLQWIFHHITRYYQEVGYTLETLLLLVGGF